MYPSVCVSVCVLRVVKPTGFDSAHADCRDRVSALFLTLSHGGARLAFFIRAAALQIRFGAKLIPNALPKSRLHLFLQLV